MRSILFILLLLPITLFGWNATPPCYKTLQAEFFDFNTLMEGFSLFKVPQGQWMSLWPNLQERVKDAPSIIKEKAQQAHPNPLDYPFQSDQARELLISTMFEIFAQLMREHNMPDEFKIRGVFEYVLSKKEKQINACLGVPKQKKS